MAGGLNVLSQRNIAAGTLVTAHRIAARQTADKFEFAARLGKPMERFYGAAELLELAAAQSDDILSIYIKANGTADGGETVLYAYPKTATPAVYSADGEFAEVDGGVYFEMPASDGYTLGVLLDAGEVDAMTRSYLIDIVRFIAILFALAAVAFFVLLKVLKLGSKAGIAVLITIQLAFGVMVALSYRGSYMRSIGGEGGVNDMLDTMLSSDVRRMEENGIPREDFYLFDEYLDEIADGIDIIDTIAVSESPDAVRLERSGVFVTLNGGMIRGKAFEYLLDALILSAVTLFLAIELIFFADRSDRMGGREQKTKALSLPTVRLMFFVLYLGVNMSAAFVVLFARDLCLKAGVTSGLLVSLPMSVEMFSGLFAIVVSGTLIRRLGFERTLYICAALSALGLLGCAVSGGVYTYTAARMFVGFGFALATITGRTIASSQTDPQLRSQILVGLTSGTLIGYCCGTVIGGLLADRFAYFAVFITAACVVALCVPLIRRTGLRTLNVSGSNKLTDIFRVMFGNAKASVHLFALVLPCYAAGMFLTYAMPLFAAESGMTTTVISALIMLNSLLAAYLSSATTGFLRKRFGVAVSAAVYAFVSAGVLLVFTFFPVFWVMLGSVALLGIADSFGLVLLSDSFMEIPFAQEKGAAVSMVAVTLSGKGGQFLAPALFSVGGAGGSPLIVGALCLTGGIAYAVTAKRVV
jgi:predicted MFS family arabinose efflux permease